MQYSKAYGSNMAAGSFFVRASKIRGPAVSFSLISIKNDPFGRCHLRDALLYATLWHRFMGIGLACRRARHGALTTHVVPIVDVIGEVRHAPPVWREMCMHILVCDIQLTTSRGVTPRLQASASDVHAHP